jgi:hypothetical protein
MDSPKLNAAPNDKHPAAETLTRVLLVTSVLLALVVTFFTNLTSIAVTDFWWQAKTGELIVRSGAIPHRDPFSWTASGQPWLVHEWLTEVFFHWAYRYLPEGVLIGYKAGLAMLACALVMVRAWLRSRSIGLSVVVAVAAGFVVRNYADLRPQMISFVLLGGLLLALDEHHVGRMRRLPLVLPLVFALWANLHGGVIVGLILITIWVAGLAAAQWLLHEEHPHLAPLALGLAASFLSVALNPNGFHVYAYPFQVLGHPDVMNYITEWWSPSFHNRDMRAFELMLLATMATLPLARTVEEPGRGSRLAEVLVLVAMAHAALFAQRNTAAFALAAAPALAEALSTLWRCAPGLALLREAGSHPLVRAVTAGGLAALTAFTLFWLVSFLPAPRKWFDHAIRLSYFPQAAVSLMKRGQWPGRLYNDYVWGGYLIWELYPQRRVFIDGRAEVYYPTKAFDAEMTIHSLKPGWEAALDQWGVEVVLTSRFGNLAQALARTQGWELAFTGEVEMVYTRKPSSSPEVPPPVVID